MADLILMLALALIALSILFGVIRLIKGDTDSDRVIAVDLLTIVEFTEHQPVSVGVGHDFVDRAHHNLIGLPRKSRNFGFLFTSVAT